MAVGRRVPAGRSRAGAGLALLLVALAPSLSPAEDRGPTTAQVTERNAGLAALWDTLRGRAAGLRIRARQELVSSGEFDGARLGWLRSEIAFEGGVPLLDGRLRIGLSPSFAWEHLLIEGTDDFLVSRTGRDVRFTDFYDTGLRLGASFDLNERWGVEAISGWSARHEVGADVSDSSQAGGSLAVTYRRGRWLRLRLGLGVGADLDDRSARISPVYRIVLRPHPRVAIESSGLGGTIDWDATDATTLSLGGQVDGTQYRLDRRGEPPTGSGDGTLQRRQTRIDFGLLHRFDENVRLRAMIGLVVDEELEISDEDGFTTERRHERDPSATFLLGIDLRL